MPGLLLDFGILPWDMDLFRPGELDGLERELRERAMRAREEGS